MKHEEYVLMMQPITGDPIIFKTKLDLQGMMEMWLEGLLDSSGQPRLMKLTRLDDTSVFIFPMSVVHISEIPRTKQ